MNKFSKIVLVFLIYSNQLHAMSDKEICKLRSDLIMAVSMERDAGKSKREVKEVIIKKFGRSLPSSAISLVDAIYETREVSPVDAGTISLYLCYKEFGLIE